MPWVQISIWKKTVLFNRFIPNQSYHHKNETIWGGKSDTTKFRDKVTI